MADVTLYKLLGVSKEQADEIARRVRASFSESKGPAEWISRLIDEFDIDQESAEIFACGWFAGKYAGVSEVFNVVAREIDEMEKDQAGRAEKENKYPPPDGYA
ncbi:MAG: hypothetical protein NTV25_09755 [Methanothrix sp.]|nr:hypothetical protein [Methanothrix sp.]